MEELYWITRLDMICGFFSFIIFIALAIGICSFLSNIREGVSIKRQLQKLWFVYILFFIGVLGITFTPTTKDALIIYGVGGTIDYVKQDSTARQLPHKVIIALDKFLDTTTEDNQNK